MHPKKSKLRKHCDSLQENVTVPEAENINITNDDSKTNDGSDTSVSYDKKTSEDLSGHENKLASPSWNTENQDSETVGNSALNTKKLLGNTKKGHDDFESGYSEVGNGKNMLQENAIMEVSDSGKEVLHEYDSSSGFVDNITYTQVRTTVEMGHNNESAVSDLHPKSAVTFDKKSIFPTLASETEDGNFSCENEDKRVPNTLPKVRMNEFRSDQSSETEDGESKTDDENVKSVQAPGPLSKVLQEEEETLKQKAKSDSSTDDDSSGNDSRHKHKSYKSQKKLCRSSNKTKIDDFNSKVDSAAVLEKENVSDASYTPRRLKIKRSPVVPQKAESKSVAMKSLDMSPEKSKKGKHFRIEITPPSKFTKKERSPKRTSSEINGKRDREKDSGKIESKKRLAEEPVSVDHTPAKVTYRKLNISFKKNEEQDNREQTSDKRRLWRSFGLKTAVNISTDSLKTIIPDFKVVCGPSLNEPEEMLSPKIASDASLPAHENSYLEESVEKMEVDEEEHLKDEDFRKEEGRQFSSKKSISQILFIQNLVRPFTLLQLKELLKRTGKLIEEEFWIDKIKSRCFVMYETTDQAEETKEALNGTRWPPSNPKILVVDFATKEEMEQQKKSAEQMKTSVPVLSLQTRLEMQEIDGPKRRRENEDAMKEHRSRKNIMYIREWDKDKLTQEESPDKEKLCPRDKPRSTEKKKDKKEGKKRQEDDTPAKLLDDLFHKTKTTPCIYWLPLTEEQAKEKEEQRKLRRLERERRNQEEEEQQRARRRRESRSPVRRR